MVDDVKREQWRLRNVNSVIIDFELNFFSMCSYLASLLDRAMGL